MTRVLFDKVLKDSLLIESHHALAKNIAFSPWESSEDLLAKCVELKPDAVLFSIENAELAHTLESQNLPLVTLLHCPQDALLEKAFPKARFNDVFTTLPNLDDLFFRVCLLTHKSYKQFSKLPVQLNIVFENGNTTEAQFVTINDHGACVSTTEKLPLKPVALKCIKGNTIYEDIVSIIKWSHPSPSKNIFSGLDFIHVPIETESLFKEDHCFSVLKTNSHERDAWIDIHGDLSKLEQHGGIMKATKNKDAVHFHLAQFETSPAAPIEFYRQLLDSIEGDVFFHRCNKSFQAMVDTEKNLFKREHIVSKILECTCSGCRKSSFRLVDKALETKMSNDAFAPQLKCVSCGGHIRIGSYITKRN